MKKRATLYTEKLILDILVLPVAQIHLLFRGKTLFFFFFLFFFVLSLSFPHEIKYTPNV